MKNKLLTISKIGLLAFTILVSQACQEDYEMVDPPMITDYDDELDEEVIEFRTSDVIFGLHLRA